MKNKSNRLTIITSVLLTLLILGLAADTVSAAQTPVDLGTAGDFVVLSKSGISTTGTTSIVGDIGVSPIDSTAITGFGLILDSSNQFSSSPLVTGKIYAAEYAPPTPTKMTTTVSDMEIAYTDAAGRINPTATELGAGDISGMTITPGLYKWGTGVLINTDVTLSGSANDVWIFQIAQDLTVGNGAIITLSGGAQAKNIFWQVAGQTTLGTTSQFKGIILSKTLISLNTGAALNGRALAQTAVTLNANAITAPTGSATSTPTTTPTQTNKPSSVEKNQTNQGIGQKVNDQIEERKEEIKSSNYTGSLGQLLNVSGLVQNLKELRVNNITAKTDLNVTAETNSAGITKFKIILKNGSERDLKIMPDAASKKALEKLRIKACSIDNNCTIQLKDVGSGNAENIQYEVKLERHSKILGIFPKKMLVSAYVDAETGDTNVHKPWWAFIATEPAE